MYGRIDLFDGKIDDGWTGVYEWMAQTDWMDGWIYR